MERGFTIHQDIQKVALRLIFKIFEVRDKTTLEHEKRLNFLITKLSVFNEINERTLSNLRLLGLLHDIGKIGIPESILFKPWSLNEEEFNIIKKHSEIGSSIVKVIPGFEYLSELILKHHEHWNGKGYPLGLTGRQIPLECRILSIIDAYDTMINPRPYKAPLGFTEAVIELRKCSGTQFDPFWVNNFIDVLKED